MDSIVNQRMINRIAKYIEDYRINYFENVLASNLTGCIKVTSLFVKDKDDDKEAVDFLGQSLNKWKK